LSEKKFNHANEQNRIYKSFLFYSQETAQKGQHSEQHGLLVDEKKSYIVYICVFKFVWYVVDNTVTVIPKISAIFAE